MGKYQVGQEVVIRGVIAHVDCTDTHPYKVKYGEGHNEFDFVSEAVLDASTPQPAPVAPDWQPKVGERVLVEATVADLMSSELILDAPMESGNVWKVICSRSAIVGPAPVRARFAVGDEVVYRPTVEIVVVREPAKHRSYVVGVTGCPFFVADETDLITLAEARERLAE